MPARTQPAPPENASSTHAFGDDPIGAVMVKYDKDGSGTFDMAEVRSIVYDVQAQGQKIGMLRKTIGLLMIIIIFTLVAMFGVSFAAGFALKDTAVASSSDGTSAMTAKDGSAITVGMSMENYGVFELGTLDMTTLTKMETFAGYVDKTSDPNVNGWVTYSGKVSSVEKAMNGNNKVTIVTTTGAQVTVDSDARTASMTDNGMTFNIVADDPTTTGRRLGRRGGGMQTAGSFRLSSGGNTAGN